LTQAATGHHAATSSTNFLPGSIEEVVWRYAPHILAHCRDTVALSRRRKAPRQMRGVVRAEVEAPLFTGTSISSNWIITRPCRAFYKWGSDNRIYRRLDSHW